MISVGLPSLKVSVPEPPFMSHTQPLPPTLPFELSNRLVWSLAPLNRSWLPVPSEAVVGLMKGNLAPSAISWAHTLLLSHGPRCRPIRRALPPPPSATTPADASVGPVDPVA